MTRHEKEASDSTLLRRRAKAPAVTQEKQTMKYFTIDELTRSNRAATLHIDNTPDAEAEANLRALVAAVLDPAREQYGKPIHVSSGYRTPKINRSLPNASITSQHMRGEAVDIFVDAGPRGNYQLGQLIARLGNFDQLIFEDVGWNDMLPGWIHVSWRRRGDNRREIRKHVKGTGSVYPMVSRKEIGL